MKNPLLTVFKNKLKANAERPKPKFQVGDIIINWKGLKLVCEVTDIKLFDNKFYEVNAATNGFTEREATKEELWNAEIGEYTLLDIVNEHRPLRPDVPANMAYVNNQFYRRKRSIQKIDSTYTKVDPKVAQILYGKKV